MIWVLKDFEARRLMKNMREIVRLEFKNLSKILMNGAANSEKKAASLDEVIDEVIKSSVENLVPIPSEFKGIFNATCDVLTCENNRVNVESDLVESLINRDTSIVYSSKIDPILEEFAVKLAHIAPIPPGIVEADFDPNDDTSSDDDSFENIEYVDASPSYSLEEENEEQEEK
ncbi:hypothetical protein Tco_0875633 [Tanacetum coccineum]|uniref:Uncharacterized protein n=1 Tax=Tanacetum coccineum TaxID=301880 RepID=A0ABQ5BSS4_9ASTR